MNLEEIYHHYSNMEHQKHLPKQLQDRNKIKESEAAIKSLSKTEQKSRQGETVATNLKIN